ncbi:MAG: hypothetical protein WC471_01565 [Candidatus Woesearchaeota archaeon]
MNKKLNCIFLISVMVILFSSLVSADVVEGIQVCQDPNTGKQMSGDACKGICLSGSKFVYCNAPATTTEPVTAPTQTVPTTTEQIIEQLEIETATAKGQRYFEEYITLKNKYSELIGELSAKEFEEKMAQLAKDSECYNCNTGCTGDCADEFQACLDACNAESELAMKEIEAKYAPMKAELESLQKSELGKLLTTVKDSSASKGILSGIGRWFRNLFGQIFFKTKTSDAGRVMTPVY